ncbi:class I SAM-dependent methyltransferase [Aequorivita sp. Q41]|uniref:THUMP-like domain-containing protein n=1 Tax=Aequorivita sp. Q41 TaxID=3153300 RepID=UPI003242BB85
MYNKKLLNNEVQDFIRNYKHEVSKLAFAGSPFKTISVQELIQQIESRKKIEKKLPRWFKTLNIFFPPKLNLEQTSSEITAKYKASLVSGNTLADVTGGFGVDSFYFSEKIAAIHHFEINTALSEVVKNNFKVFGKQTIECFASDGMKAVLNTKYDVIYIDPSRRHESKGKVFFLKDCEPNVPENIHALLTNCKKLLIKTSPMLDISVGLNELKNVSEIHIVAVNNEVKELLWVLKKDVVSAPYIKTINFTKPEIETFNFTWNETLETTYSLPQKYLYEPNAAILKSGAFNLLSERLKIKKLQKHTHLYTNDTLINFPGRSFIIKKVVPYTKSEIRAAITFKKANITTRNFSESVDVLRKKWKITDGGAVYLFFITNSEDKKVMLICSKL